VYDHATRVSRLVRDMAQGRYFHGQMLLQNLSVPQEDDVLVASGGYTDYFPDIIEYYRSRYCAFATIGRMSRSRINATVTKILVPFRGYFRDAVLVTGGYSKPDSFSVILGDGTAELVPVAYPSDSMFVDAGASCGSVGPALAVSKFPPAQSQLLTMRAARTKHTATYLYPPMPGTVLIAGGTTTESRAELYDAQANTFQFTGSMTMPRWSHTATRLNDGRVVIVGGYTTAPGTVSGSARTATAEIYDPATGQFSPAAGVMQQARSGHTATLLADGRVLIVGVVSATEIFDPSTATFSPGPALAVARLDHAAVLQWGGGVLVTGGRTSGGAALRSIEVLNP
jgi:hypothetical protein